MPTVRNVSWLLNLIILTILGCGVMACQTVGHISSKGHMVSMSSLGTAANPPKKYLDLRPVGFAPHAKVATESASSRTDKTPGPPTTRPPFPAPIRPYHGQSPNPHHRLQVTGPPVPPVIRPSSPATARAPSAAKKKYTLPELLALAWKHSPRQREAKYLLESFRARRSEAVWSSWWPQGAVTGVIAPAPPARGDALRTTTPYPEAYNRSNQYGILTRVEMSLVWPLYTFGKLALLQYAASHGIRLGEANILLEQSKWHVLVKQAYYGLQLAESSLALLDEADEQITEAKKKVKGKTDQLKIEVIESQVLSRRVQAETGRQLALSGLARLAGLPPHPPIQLAESELAEVEIKVQDLAEYQRLAERHRPELKVLAHALRAKKALLDAQRRMWLPDLFVAGFFRWGYSSSADDQLSPFARDDFNFLEGGIMLGARLALDVPITIAKIRHAEAEFEVFHSQKMLATQGIQMQVEQRYRELLAAQRLLQIHKRGRKAANQWMTKSMVAFQSGLVEIKEVSDALLAYAQTQFSYLEAMFNLRMAVAQLTRAVGTEIHPPKS